MQDPADRHETLVTLTADIVSAHVSNNTIKPVKYSLLIIQIVQGRVPRKISFFEKVRKTGIRKILIMHQVT